MAVFDKQSKMLEILPQGMNPSAADKGASWIQNMEKMQGSWQTRAGFGTIAILDSQMTTGKEVVDGFQSVYSATLVRICLPTPTSGTSKSFRFFGRMSTPQTI
jgi:hypothetical protein